MRGLQPAPEQQAEAAELHDLPLSNLEEPPQAENIPLRRSRSRARHVCHTSPNSPCVAEGCPLHGQSAIAQKRCRTRFKPELHAAKEGFDDGFTWRKYGQKNFSGRRHPRSDYRCCHKGDLTCPARKLVQECDGIAGSFHITYIGKHTCKGACEGPYRTSESYAAPISSPLISANSHTGMPAIMQAEPSPMQAEPSPNASEVEIQKEVQYPAINGAATSTRSLLGALPEHEHPMQLTSAAYSPLQVSCTISSEKPPDNSPNLGADVKEDPEQQEESSTHSGDSPLPLYREFEPSPGFVEYFEGQLQL